MYTLVNPFNVEEHWPRVAPWLTLALGPYETWIDLSFIKEKAKAGFAQIWIGHKPQSSEIDLVLITESMTIDEKSTLVVRWAAGKDMDEWFGDLGLLEAWAKANGFYKIQVWGRRGWERKLRPLGYTHEFSVVGRLLDRGVH
jgi:hypothetical protein